MDIYNNLGMKIRRVRKDRGFTQEELGREAGIDPKYIGEIERGNANITIKTLLNISEVLDITIGELLSFTLAGKESLDIQNEAIEIAKMLKGVDRKERKILIEMLKKMIEIARRF